MNLLRSDIEVATLMSKTMHMKVPENVMTEIAVTTYGRDGGGAGDTILLKMRANSATGWLHIAEEEVGASRSEDSKEEEILNAAINPGTLAQFCAAYLAAYHDVRGMR